MTTDRTETGQAAPDPTPGPRLPGLQGPGGRDGPGKTSTPALVVMSLDLPPEAVVSTVPVPSWCVGPSHCEVQAVVVDAHRALVRVSGAASHADTPSSREAFWLASAGPAFWFEPGPEEPWVDGGVSVGSVASARRCGDEAVARATRRARRPGGGAGLALGYLWQTRPRLPPRARARRLSSRRRCASDLKTGCSRHRDSG